MSLKDGKPCNEAKNFPDLFLLCTDVEATRKKWEGHTIVVLNFEYPKPHTMLAVILEEKEIQLWQERVSGGR